MKILQYNNNQIVNILGKYIYKNIDGAYKIFNESNKCHVYFVLYYQYTLKSESPDKDYEYSDLYEMKFDVDITTYDKFIRVNITEMSPHEITIGHLRYDVGSFHNISQFKQKVLADVKKKIENRYSEYMFVY